MKKYIFLPIAALALGFAACEDDDTLGIPVVNPEIPAVNPSIVSVAPVAGLETISLETYNNNDQNVPVATISADEEWPEGYNFGAIAQLSTDESFANPYEISTVVNGTTILLNPEEVQGYIYDNITKDPAQQTLWMRFGMQAVNGKETIRLGNADSFIGVQQINVIPFSPAAVIEPNYYLIYTRDADTWSKANSVEFAHSDKSPYDDPNFTLIWKVPADYTDGVYWKVIPQSTYDTFDLENGLVIGVPEADAESRSGHLDESADQFAGYIDMTGQIMMEINLDRVTAITGADDEKKDAMTFSYKQALEFFWLAGDNVNGLNWSFADDPTMWTKNFVDYAGIAVLGSEFKFSPTNGWSGDFGSDGGLTFADENGELIGKGEATGGKNINVAEPGLYYISLNYVSKALQLVKLNSWGIIGGFNSWDESVEMTKVDDFTYTVTQTLNEGDEWKFRANGQWSVSLGGTFDNLDPFNGPNFKCTESGTYDITLDLSTLPWTAKVDKI